MNRREKIDKIVSYIKKGETNPKDYKLGLEMEHFCVDKEDLTSLDYFGDLGVGKTLKRLEEIGFKVNSEHDGYILGLEKDEYEVTIEPAGQLEVSIDGKISIDQVKESYDRVMKQIVPIFDEKNQYLVTLGYHPKSKIDDLDTIPKDRYKFMIKYFKEFGQKYALNMMKGTASLQTAIDFENEKDFADKFFVANALSVFLYSAFENTHIFEGEIYQKRNLRQEIWQYCDNKRTGVYDFAFDKDLSYEKYAQRILDTDIIFVNKDNEDIYMADTKFEEIMEDDDSEQMIFHALSIVFPDVRVKRYIEIRMPDEVPAPYNFAFLAFIKGIFYNKENLSKMKEIFKDMTYDKYLKLREDSYTDGINTKYKDKTISQWMISFMDMAKTALDQEAKYLDPLYELMLVNTTLRDKFRVLYEQDPKIAVERFSLSYYLDKEDED